MPASLAGKVCLVTGASQGFGRGIAVQLGQAGALVYVTGRNKPKLEDCANEIKKRGGTPVMVVMDHAEADEVEKLFERIKKEQQGRLDLLVNNAFAGGEILSKTMGKKFWETAPVEAWDAINNVGLRNHYICSVYAARMMVPQKSGLIVNISSSGGLNYLFNVAYGTGKAACDRMSADCALELRPKNVAVVSLWPGPAKDMADKATDPFTKKMMEAGESREFSGKAVVCLAQDPKIMKKSGHILMTADLAREYGFLDEDGKVTGDSRSIKQLLKSSGWNKVAACVPKFVRVPHLFVYYSGYKF